MPENFESGVNNQAVPQNTSATETVNYEVEDPSDNVLNELHKEAEILQLEAERLDSNSIDRLSTLPELLEDFYDLPDRIEDITNIQSLIGGAEVG